MPSLITGTSHCLTAQPREMSSLFELMCWELQGGRHRICSLQLRRAPGPAQTSPKSLLPPDICQSEGTSSASLLPWTGFSGGICCQVSPHSASQWLVLKLSHPKNMSQFLLLHTGRDYRNKFPTLPVTGNAKPHLTLCISAFPREHS